jgi:hypothetical protein
MGGRGQWKRPFDFPIHPFLAAQIVLLILLTLWPGMALLLPNTVK